MDELSGRPEALTPFTQVLKKSNVDFERVMPDDKKVIGTYCMMVPQELIYAAGAENVKLCSGSFTGFSIGEDITPRDACPLVKAVAGMQEIGKLTPYTDCDLMVVPVTCDCKKKLASMLAETTPVHVMQVPSIRQSDELLELYTQELYRFIPVLERVT